jgi:hypothetical protein
VNPKFSQAWVAEHAKRNQELDDWRERVTAAAEMLARQLPTLEGHPVPFNVAKPLAALGLVVEDKPLPLPMGDWEEADGR